MLDRWLGSQDNSMSFVFIACRVHYVDKTVQLLYRETEFLVLISCQLVNGDHREATDLVDDWAACEGGLHASCLRVDVRRLFSVIVGARHFHARCDQQPTERILLDLVLLKPA